MTIDRKKKKTAKVSLRESLNNCQTMWREKKEREKLAKMPSQMAHISKLNYQYVSEKCWWLLSVWFNSFFSISEHCPLDT